MAVEPLESSSSKLVSMRPGLGEERAPSQSLPCREFGLRLAGRNGVLRNAATRSLNWVESSLSRRGLRPIRAPPFLLASQGPFHAARMNLLSEAFADGRGQGLCVQGGIPFAGLVHE